MHRVRPSSLNGSYDLEKINTATARTGIARTATARTATARTRTVRSLDPPST